MSEQKRHNKIKSLLGRRKKEFNSKFLNNNLQNTVPSPVAPQAAVRGEKGLLNEAGANNCFLNVVLQVWEGARARIALVWVFERVSHPFHLAPLPCGLCSTAGCRPCRSACFDFYFCCLPQCCV